MKTTATTGGKPAASGVGELNDWRRLAAVVHSTVPNCMMADVADAADPTEAVTLKSESSNFSSSLIVLN